MKKSRWMYWLATWAALLAGASAFAEEIDRGEAVLPGEALREIFDDKMPFEGLRKALQEIRRLRWDSSPAAGEPEEQAMGGGPFSASLLQIPLTRALPGAVLRECADVYRERKQVRAWIARTTALCEAIEPELAALERRCPRSGPCDTSRLDRWLAELRKIVAELGAYAEREQAAKPDRELVYRFHLDEAPGYAFRRAGWWPVGAANVTRARFYKSPWVSGAAVYAEEGGLAAPPVSRANGVWEVRRRLTATHACVNGQVFRLEFQARFQQWPADQRPVAGADGTVEPAPDRAVRTESIEAISL